MFAVFKTKLELKCQNELIFLISSKEFVLITEIFWKFFWRTFWRHYLTLYKTPAIISFHYPCFLGGSNRNKKCRYVDKQVPRTIYETSYKTQCHQSYENECQTSYETSKFYIFIRCTRANLVVMFLFYPLDADCGQRSRRINDAF